MKAQLRLNTLAGTLALAGALAAPSIVSAQTECLQYDFSRPWVALQTNGYRVEFRLNQQRPRVFGTASFGTPRQGGIMGAFGEHVSGRVTGTIVGDAVELHTQWGGVYIGSVDHRGRLVGTTVDKAHPTARSRANWISDRQMNCLVSKVPPSTPDVYVPGRSPGAAAIRHVFAAR